MVIDFIGESPKSGNYFSTLDHPDQEGNNRQEQQNVDEPAHCVGSDEPENPQHKQDYENCPEHFDSPCQTT
jgi:hypothetical protein